MALGIGGSFSGPQASRWLPGQGAELARPQRLQPEDGAPFTGASPLQEGLGLSQAPLTAPSAQREKPDSRGK